ncbi:DNA polymerase III subunit [Aeromonas phage Gekk3-15]
MHPVVAWVQLQLGKALRGIRVVLAELLARTCCCHGIFQAVTISSVTGRVINQGISDAVGFCNWNAELFTNLRQH